MIKPLSIKIYPLEGGVLQVEEATLSLDEGIVGNKHDDISFLSVDALQFQKNNPDGMCMARFKENIVLDIDFRDIDTLELGDAVVEISSGKRFCFERCKYFDEGKLCSFKVGVAFGKVIKSGIIKT
ncbi:MAG: hypothetical protein FWC69_00525 [Defluviitaleaceae bacterium]|nr:hypothetical protein [Defluviitaleaceae bacterium]